jgi:Icc-related predicted phosphoesterase
LPKVQVELLIACGDLCDDVILHTATATGARQILAVKGNHDSSSPFPSQIVDLHLRTSEVGGLTFGGFGGSWKYKPKGHHLFEQHEVESALHCFPRVDVFVAHNSPRLIHDRDDDVHCGFVAFSNYIEQHQPRYFLHGHQHVHQETTVGQTKVIGTFGFRSLTISA